MAKTTKEETTQPVGRPRRDAEVKDLIIKLKEAQIISKQLIGQNPRWKMRLGNINKTIAHWCKITIKRIDNAPDQD